MSLRLRGLTVRPKTLFTVSAIIIARELISISLASALWQICCIHTRGNIGLAIEDCTSTEQQINQGAIVRGRIVYQRGKSHGRINADQVEIVLD